MAAALEMTGIVKYFASSDVLANNKVSFSVEEGDVHALVGENGAGKTTLMNILYGLYKQDAGDILLDGQPVTIDHPDDAIRLGIGMVHQHFKLVPGFTVAENIMLGMEVSRAGLLRRKEEIEAVRRLAESYGLPVDPEAKVRDLSVGMQQRVEILKVLQREARILILDEPTAVLTPQEVRELLAVVRNLTQHGHTVIFITHKLPEVKSVADRVSVMRNGRMIGSKAIAETTIGEMASMMVGRDVQFSVDKAPATVGDVVLEVEDVTVADARGIPAILHFSTEVYAGEVLGIAGVSGNGQKELVAAITGMQAVEAGHIRFLGQDITRYPVKLRRQLGMAHVPEDRIEMGLNLETNLDENLVVSRYMLPQYNRFGFMRRGAMREFARQVIERFSISAARPGREIVTLSGGNMQKVVLGRELAGDPILVVANQPTRGLDVGSIEFVHRTLLDARDQGTAILLISVELDEIMSLSDRILVLYQNQIAGEVDPAQTTKEEIGLLMGGSSLEFVEPEWQREAADIEAPGRPN
jgi:simple sugar transport system ATP-binding protein